MENSAYEIIKKFISFFKANNHFEIKNSSIVPNNDPTLLFINSGMAAIKSYFTAEKTPEHGCLCNVQNCIRTIDIDDVGDNYHLTSFQMLGNWSIGDSYFKKGAIKLAFRFLTECLNIDIDKLYVSVFAGDKNLGIDFDEESKENWISAGIAKSHIVVCGLEDNFWGPTSKTGPCGPCTEVFYDTGKGEEYKHGGFFDTKRYVEIWNAGVFMMFNKNEIGEFVPLAFRSVDAGAGLERLAMVLQNCDSVYETDLLKPIRNFLENKIKSANNELNSQFERYIRILTDHLRTISLILSENVKPSNEGRGYIPRKLIRKCMMILKNLDSNSGYLCGSIEFILNSFSNIYPRFKSNKGFILKEFSNEIKKFESILDDGFKRLSEFKSKNIKEISGDLAFDLVSTFGVPFDLIKSYAVQNNIKISEEEFNIRLEHHKNISKKENVEKNSDVNSLEISFEEKINSTEFLGYDKLEIESEVIKMFLLDGTQVEKISENKEVILIFNRTPVYAKSGGQESDFAVATSNNVKIEIKDCFKKNINGKEFFLHKCEIMSGSVKKGDVLKIKVNFVRRTKLSRAHSAAHLLHNALKNVLGKEVQQQGSSISEDRFRFDFNCDSLDMAGLQEIEKLVNKKICKNMICSTEVISRDKSLKSGANALFEEKYGDYVRVVSFDDFSVELCGGTHVKSTSEICSFAIISSENIGKGLKRVNAYVGEKAFEYFQEKISTLHDACKMLNSNFNDFLTTLDRKINIKINKKKFDINKEDLTLAKCKMPLYYADVGAFSISSQKVLKLTEKLKAIVAIIFGENSKNIVFAIDPSLNLKANSILNEVLKKHSGNGGGNSKCAYGNFPNLSAKEIIKEIINNL
ncbi:MAG: alanine--tRNA ligase [Candidatus Improbicoccus pseudotrichonymphae]|uniref:Alanine--tRNA ligase n=1 Tax=Candidatus Improbicoccus pseudotrichonymphae TaxID=3033792 RepID=A0AA48HUU1_9FIRM|nr:MAG: alanine--tRNA ligase [Candidatus Improbicoccus pseudotrichonymphae]